ncbi:MAG: YihY family inner membrane protein [Tepidisphaera sp.]|nr:YihY family inner membrane protein [Tepidisphaera sp.]
MPNGQDQPQHGNHAHPAWSRGFFALADAPPPGRKPGVLRHIFLTSRLVIAGLRQSQLTRMAAALTYRTLFGLIPVLVVGLVGLASFSTPDEQRDALHKVLTYAGIDQISFQDEEADDHVHRQHSETPAPSQGDAAAQPAPDAKAATPQPDFVGPPSPGQRVPSKLDRVIAGAVERAKTVRGRVAAVGFLTLFYAAISMLVEIEKAFNQICNAPEGRSWVRRISQYWALLSFGPILLFLSFFITEYISSFASHLPLTENGEVRRTMLSVLAFASACFTSTLMLTIIYVTVPNTRILVTPATLGALVAAIAWEAGKLGITKFVQFSAGYQQVYGALAILPLFLMWLYISWLIVLVGLQLAYSMQTYRQATAKGLTESVLIALGLKPDPNPPGRPRLIDGSAPLLVMVAVGERFEKGQRSDHSSISERTGLDAVAAAAVLEQLAGAGLLLRVAEGDRQMSYSLARPAAHIRAIDVLDVADSLAQGDKRKLSVGQLLERARRDALRNTTLAQLLEQNEHAAPSDEPQTLPAPQPATS